jgi:sugar lactone lactonase YvrE
LFDVNGHTLQDSDRRWATEYDETTFMVGITKDVARVSSVGDGDLETSRWRTESPVQVLKVHAFGSSEAEVHARLDAWRNVFNQENLEIGRTLAGVRRVVTARLESISQTVGPIEPETGASLVASFRITGAYWRAESTDEVTLSAGANALSALLDSTAPIADCKLLIAGGSTELTAFSIEDAVSRSGIGWSVLPIPIGTYLSQFGSYGASNGLVNAPGGIAVDASGNIYIVDTGNSRVQKFSSAGVYISQFGSYGTADGQFKTPYGIALDSSGNIFVTDALNSRVTKFNSSGVYQSKFGAAGSGDGQFLSLRGIAIDASNNIFVVDANNNRVQKFNSSGTFVAKVGSFGSGNGQFGSNMYGIAVDGSGNVLVTEPFRIQKFSNSLVYSSQFGSSGSANGQFTYAIAIRVDGAGNIWVTDRVGRIQKFNSAGVYQMKFGSSGAGAGQFNNPDSFAFDTSGNLFVADSYLNRVQKFDIDGAAAGLTSGQYLLIDLVSRSAQVVTSNSFDAVGDAIGGITTVPWAGDKLRLTSKPSDPDILIRELNVTVSQTGGGTAKLRAKKAYL